MQSANQLLPSCSPSAAFLLHIKVSSACATARARNIVSLHCRMSIRQPFTMHVGKLYWGSCLLLCLKPTMLNVVSIGKVLLTMRRRFMYPFCKHFCCMSLIQADHLAGVCGLQHRRSNSIKGDMRVHRSISIALSHVALSGNDNRMHNSWQD